MITDETHPRREFSIHLEMFLRVSNERAAIKVLGWLGAALGGELQAIKYEPYWKDRTLYRATATLPLQISDVREAVFDTLTIWHRVGESWSVTGPYQVADGFWEMQGRAERIQIPGLHLVWATLSDDPTQDVAEELYTT